MNCKLTATLLVLCAALGATHADTVYKYDGPEGTTYSDRPEPDAATPGEKVQLPAGPSEAEQRAAKQRVQEMQETSAEMEESRRAAQQARERQEAQKPPDTTEEPVGGSSTVLPRRDPKTRIPIESPDGGEHPIYDPNKRPVGPPGIPRPPIARPAQGR